MTGLVDLVAPDGVIALGSIVTIGEPRERTRRWGKTRVRDITCADGSVHAMGVAFVDSLLRRPMQLMPAEAGTYALNAWSDEDERGVSKVPVIAWALCVDGDVRPVTPQGVNSGGMMDDGEGYVLMPNGSVQAIGEHTEPVWFDTLDEYSAHVWKAIEARRSAPSAVEGEGDAA